MSPTPSLQDAAPIATSPSLPVTSVQAQRRKPSMIFFRLNTWVLLLVLAAIMVGATLAGLAIGRRVSLRASNLREPFGILQGALIGFMGLVLAFGLSLAVGRYES